MRKRLPVTTTQQARQLRREQTPAERYAWTLLRGRRLLGFKFRRQEAIAGFFVDFYCPALRLGVELDGSGHEEQTKQTGDRGEEQEPVPVVRIHLLLNDGDTLKILVLGAGAIGGYFGGRLAEAGADITFLVRPKRREQIEKDGLRVTSPLGDMKIAAKTVLTEKLKPGYDLVLFTCKAYDLESAIEAITPAMGGKAVLVPMLNGLAHLDRLDKQFGREAILGGACMIDVTLRKDGVIVHPDNLQKMVFGPRDPTHGGAAKAFGEQLAKTKIEWELSDNITQSMWEKLSFLSALAATTCLFRANVREIMSAPDGRDALGRALETNMAIAAREGHAARPPALEWARNRLMDPNGLWSASMLRDVEAGGQHEGDHIIGWMLAKARKHRLDDTILSLAQTHLKAYEARKAAGRLPA